MIFNSLDGIRPEPAAYDSTIQLVRDQLSVISEAMAVLTTSRGSLEY